MDIEYNKIKTKLSLPEKFSEFKKLCIQKFYISELRSQKMIFYYVDEDNDNVNLDENSYKNEDARKAKFWKLLIEENKRKISSNSTKKDHSKKEFIAQKEALMEEAKLYKEKIFGECSKIIEIKIKQKNEEHKKDIQTIKDAYAKCLKDFKNLVDNKIKELIDKISENTMEVYMEKSKYINKKFMEIISKKLGEFEDYKKDLEVNMGEIGNNINDTYINVKECCDIFQDIILNPLLKISNFIIFDTIIENNIDDLKNDITFEIKIRKFLNTHINNSFLRILSTDLKKYEDIKIDLSDIHKKYTEKKLLLIHILLK